MIAEKNRYYAERYPLIIEKEEINTNASFPTPKTAEKYAKSVGATNIYKCIESSKGGLKLVRLDILR